LDEIHRNYLQPCRDKNLALFVHKPSISNKTHINSDQGLLYKVLRHLVDNSVKFTKTGFVSYGFDVKGNELEFFVKDTGVGIKKEIQPTIFDKFIQENTFDTRGHEGSGLGLSIVKGIVELLGGRVWLESEKNAGSSFFFTIPDEA
jgi:signal transduction histidine kinase